MAKKDIYSSLDAVASQAALHLNTEAKPASREVRAKTLKNIPVSFYEAHADLRSKHKTNLDFSNYITEALREKLERDGGL